MNKKYQAAVMLSYLPSPDSKVPMMLFDEEDTLTMVEIDVLKRDIKHSLLRIKTVRDEQAARRKAKDGSGETVRK
jgi:hypothetical protein